MASSSARALRVFAGGVDFAFSYPHEFVKQEAGTASAFWHHVATEGERWLLECPQPFFGKPGKKSLYSKSDTEGPLYRRTDRREGLILPTSPFQIGGAGAVGVGSLRGIPRLLELRDAGFRIWPFQTAGSHTVVEIYPRAFTGPVNKGNATARGIFMRNKRSEHLLFANLTDKQLAQVVADDNAFDALVSAIEMRRRTSSLHLPPAIDEREMLEGRVFRPPPLN